MVFQVWTLFFGWFSSKVTFEQLCCFKKGSKSGEYFFFFKVPKTNIEHEQDGLEDDFSFQTGLVFRFYVNFPDTEHCH